MPDRPATLRDVAAAARVHPATASRALNPETRILVSEDTARRVTDAAARLGYRPNPVARSLRTRRSHTVGVLIPDLNNPLFPPIVRGLEDKLAAAGYVALIGNTRIAHVAGPQEASTGISRLRGFRDGMATHGLAVDEDLIAYATRYTVEEGARCCRDLLARAGDITAVAAANDMLAVGCYSAL